MCIIAHCPAGTEITRDRAKRLWDRNPDGGGFAYRNHEGELTIQKAMEFKDWWQRYRGTIKNFPESDFLLHMRIGTHGSKCIDNVHPFRVDEHTIMAHNGIISWAKTTDPHDDRSDTRIFVDLILPELPKLWLDNPALRRLVEESIGSSKLVFYTTDPELSMKSYIIGEHKGDWIDDIWFSNTYSVREPVKYVHTAASVEKKTVYATDIYDDERVYGAYQLPFQPEPKAWEIKTMLDGSKIWSSTASGTIWKKSHENDSKWVKIGEMPAEAEPVKDLPPAFLDPRDDLRERKEHATIKKVESDRAAFWELNSQVEFNKDGELECVQCEETITEDEGWVCVCHDWACMDCLNMLNDCSCANGISMNKAELTERTLLLMESIKDVREDMAEEVILSAP